MRTDRSSVAARARALAAGLVAFVLLAPSSARGQAAPPGGHEDAAFDLMNVMAEHGLHDIHYEPWNVYGQFTYISSWKLPLSAPYTNANGSPYSLISDGERRDRKSVV